mmetsp:Transcript_90460/g.165672  ORF Transcript_90460/g.165672 Transcript_90460/m.165672 type:complete len:207 (-) Transcript_90460:238-858(-)
MLQKKIRIHAALAHAPRNKQRAISYGYHQVHAISESSLNGNCLNGNGKRTPMYKPRHVHVAHVGHQSSKLLPKFKRVFTAPAKKTSPTEKGVVLMILPISIFQYQQTGVPINGKRLSTMPKMPSTIIPCQKCGYWYSDDSIPSQKARKYKVGQTTIGIENQTIWISNGNHHSDCAYTCAGEYASHKNRRQLRSKHRWPSIAVTLKL